MARYRVAIDIGGTFTDFVFADRETGQAFTGKSLTTSANQAEGVMSGLRELVPNATDIDFVVHGTTAGLNAFLERKGTRVLLIATAGLRDSYSIARGDRKELFVLHYHKPKRLVPRRDVLEVRERLRWDGSIDEPLHEEDFEPIIARIVEEHIKAVAVCFVHAYINPTHELAARRILKEALPDLSITLSHEVAREWREYERASSAVLNAYIAPIVERYLGSLESENDEFGVSAPLHWIQSDCGVMNATASPALPIQTLLSGPVGGTIGGGGGVGGPPRPQLLFVGLGGGALSLLVVLYRG